MAVGEGQKQNNQAKELILPQLAVEGQTGYEDAVGRYRKQLYDRLEFELNSEKN